MSDNVHTHYPLWKQQKGKCFHTFSSNASATTIVCNWQRRPSLHTADHYQPTLIRIHSCFRLRSVSLLTPPLCRLLRFSSFPQHAVQTSLLILLTQNGQQAVQVSLHALLPQMATRFPGLSPSPTRHSDGNKLSRPASNSYTSLK